MRTNHISDGAETFCRNIVDIPITLLIDDGKNKTMNANFSKLHAFFNKKPLYEKGTQKVNFEIDKKPL